MMTIIRTWYHKEGKLAHFVIAFVVIAVLLDVASFLLGIAIAQDSSGRGFFESMNWGPYPLFLILVGWLVYLTWHPYLDAWSTLGSQGLVKHAGSAVNDHSALRAMIEEIRSKRRLIIAIAFILAVVMSCLVDRCLWGDYGVFDVAPCTGEKGEGWGQAFNGITVDGQTRFPKISQRSNGLFVLSAYTMMAALIGLGLLALGQVFLHSYYFLQARKKIGAGIPGAQFRLNHRDPREQFGLSDWNYAINNGYIMIAAAMLIPLLSDFAQLGGGTWEASQYLFAILLPLILFAPAYVPWITRYYLRRDVEIHLRDTNASDGDWKWFNEQRIWPFDRHPIGKVFLGAALALYLAIVGQHPTIKALIESLLP